MSGWPSRRVGFLLRPVRRPGECAATVGPGSHAAKVWCLETGKLLETFDGHRGFPLGAAFSADGRRLLTCDTAAVVRLWKLGRP